MVIDIQCTSRSSVGILLTRYLRQAGYTYLRVSNANIIDLGPKAIYRYLHVNLRSFRKVVSAEHIAHNIAAHLI